MNPPFPTQVLVCESALADFATNAALRDVAAAVRARTHDARAAKKLAAALPRHSPAKDAAAALNRNGGDVALALDRVPFRARSLWLHAYQSYVFNLGAAARAAEASLDVRETDVLDDEGRVALPLVGKDLPAPPDASAAGRAMRAQIAADGVAPADFARERLRGATRPLVLQAQDWRATYDAAAKTLALAFELPAGAYATTLLRELFSTLKVVHSAHEPPEVAT